MICPSCRADNPAGAKFCMECGASLPRVCEACGAELPPAARFCIECGAPTSGDGGRPAAHARRSRDQAATEPDRESAGERVAPEDVAPRAYTPRHLAEKILKSKSAMEGERKHVTVLFADVKESLDLAEQVDPETWHQILDGFFAILSNGVHRFEGTINQYTGDGIMALFGAPIAHEDHAHRACFAALHLSDGLSAYADEIRRTHGLNFSVRIGINSGDVVVGKIGDDLRMDYTAQGHTVGLASRVEQLAAPNTVYVADDTAALVAGYFRLRDLGQFTLKGVREPVRVHQLTGIGEARTRLDVSRSRGFSRFVGRSTEMKALDDALDRVRRGERAVVGVVAEAGAGKSRLCYEFAERHRSRGVPVYEAHCVAHGAMLPLVPVLELLRAYFGISDQEDDRAAREKLAGRLLLLDDGLKDTLPHVFEFMGVADPDHPAPAIDPAVRRQKLYVAFQRVLDCEEDCEQVDLIVFEDLHWIDGASDSFLAELIELLVPGRTLLIVNMRPGYEAPWMAEPYYQEIQLEPLGQSAIAALLRDLLGADPSLGGLAERIAERTAGNPFFVEEVVRALLEAGTLEGTHGAYRLANPYGEIVIPATVQGVLTARIDRLEARDKRVLETAAVIGKEFDESLLRRIAGEGDGDLTASLQGLMDGGFLEQIQSYPDVRYAFHHPLTQEVAYREQLHERRSATHRDVAAALEESCCGKKAEDNAALLAHHWENAGDRLKAVLWSKRAAEWAATRDLREARRHWMKVRELLDVCDECPQSIAVGIHTREQLIENGWKLGVSLDETRALYEEGRALAERSADHAGVARVMSGFAMAELFSGDVEHGLVDLERAAEAAERADDAELNVMMHGRLAYMYLLAGRVARALEFFDAAVEFAERAVASGVKLQSATSTTWLGALRMLPRAYLGDLRIAGEEITRALALVRGTDDRSTLSSLHGFASTLAWFKGDAAEALTHAREQFTLAESLTSPALLAGAYDSLGVAYAMGGEAAQAVEACERALATARESGTLLQSEAVFITNLAAAYLVAGDLERATARAREGVATAARRLTPLWECRGLIVLARALLASGSRADVSEVERALARALAIVAESGAVAYEPFIRVELAELARLTGDSARAEVELSSAARQFAAMGADALAERYASRTDAAASA